MTVVRPRLNKSSASFIPSENEPPFELRQIETVRSSKGSSRLLAIASDNHRALLRGYLFQISADDVSYRVLLKLPNGKGETGFKNALFLLMSPSFSLGACLEHLYKRWMAFTLDLRAIRQRPWLVR